MDKEGISMSLTESKFYNLPLYNIFNLCDIRILSNIDNITELATISVDNNNSYSFVNGLEEYRVQWLPLEGYLVFALYENNIIIRTNHYVIHEIEYFFYDITKMGERGTLIIEVDPFSDNASCKIYITDSGTEYE